MAVFFIAGLTFEIKNGDQSADRLIPFLCCNQEPELHYEIKYVDYPENMIRGSEIAAGHSIRVYQANNTRISAHLESGHVHAVTEESENHVTIYLPQDAENKPWHRYYLTDLLNLERHLLKKDAFVLHAAYIATPSGAILFTAPSGGGKTTQANLWIHHLGARMINGDKAAISRKDGTWYAHGLPVSGSSEYFLNESMPIRAIVILEKWPENQIFPLGSAGFPRIFSQVIQNTWDIGYTEKIMDLVADAVSTIPIYLYRCTKESDAAVYLHHYLYGKDE